jgi:hypothetical protein
MATSNWKQYLRTEPSPSESKIRHEIEYVPIALLAKQFYCEQQLDFEYQFGKITTDEEKLGTMAHEDIFAGDEVELEPFIKYIEEEFYYKCTFPLYFKFKGITFRGKPDAMIFSKGKPLFLIELKTTSGNLYKVYKNERIQTEAYAFALENMEFDCGELRLIIIKMDSLSYELYKEDCIEAIHKAIVEKFFNDTDFDDDPLEEINELTLYDIASHSVDFDVDAFSQDIELASEYWLMERDAIGADALKHSRDSKCVICNYIQECPAYSKYIENKKINQKKRAKIRKLYPKYGDPWTKEDLIVLQKQVSQGKSIDQITQSLQRNQSSIVSKIKQLGLAQPNSAALRICNACYYQEDCVLDVAKRIQHIHDEDQTSINERYQNKGKPWEDDDIARLKNEFKHHKSIYELAEIFQRTPKSIMIQLIMHDVISCRLKKIMPYMI